MTHIIDLSHLSDDEKPVAFENCIIEAKSGYVGLQFLKKDGSRRTATTNFRDHNEVKGTGKPRLNPFVFTFREVHNKEEDKTVWRSLDVRRLVRMTFAGKTFIFQK